MIRRPPRSTLDRSSAASDVYKRQDYNVAWPGAEIAVMGSAGAAEIIFKKEIDSAKDPVSYTHLRAHETVLDLVCRLLLEKKKKP